MKMVRVILVAGCAMLAAHPANAADNVYPVRPAQGGEGRPTWWWDSFYRPVVVVRGTLAETQKERPDLSIQGPYDTWSKLTAPSLANQPTEKGFYLLLTRLKVNEVLYVDPTLLHGNANINWLADGKKDEFDCILPASLTSVSQVDESGETTLTKDGRYSFVYKLSLPGKAEVPAGKEFILIFHYVNIYPIQGLHLTSFTEIDNLEQVRAISAYRREHQSKP